MHLPVALASCWHAGAHRTLYFVFLRVQTSAGGPASEHSLRGVWPRRQQLREIQCGGEEVAHKTAAARRSRAGMSNERAADVGVQGVWLMLPRLAK